MKRILVFLSFILLASLGCRGQVLHNSPDSISNTNAASKAKMPELPTYNSIYDMLMTIPGVEVRGREIKVRGATTISSNASTDPLLLLDGVEISNLDEISPYDIHSIEVVKDGSSAIYGSKAVGGVILFRSKAAQMSLEADKQRRQEEAARRAEERERKKAEKAAARAAKKAANQNP